MLDIPRTPMRGVHDLHRPSSRGRLHRADIRHHGTLRTRLVRTPSAPDMQTHRSAACASVQSANVAQVRSQPPADRRSVGGGAFHGKVVGQPVDLARDVVVDLGEAERFEPARGSWAHVSKSVPAVDDHRPVPVEAGRRGGVEGLEWDVERVGQVQLDVLLCRQDLDELGAVIQRRPRAGRAIDVTTGAPQTVAGRVAWPGTDVAPRLRDSSGRRPQPDRPDPEGRSEPGRQSSRGPIGVGAPGMPVPVTQPPSAVLSADGHWRDHRSRPGAGRLGRRRAPRPGPLPPGLRRAPPAAWRCGGRGSAAAAASWSPR